MIDNITKIIDSAIEDGFTTRLWFIKYKGNILFPTEGVRGFKNISTAKNRLAKIIYTRLGPASKLGKEITPNYYKQIAAILNISMAKLKSMQYFSNTIYQLTMCEYIKRNVIPKLEEEKIIEFVLL